MSSDILIVFSILLLTIVLFITEKVRVDVVAVIIMLTLAWTRVITPHEAISGLSSNAVVSMAGVMVLGYGLDRSGFTNKLIKPIIKLSGSKERGIISVISMTVGGLSAFMQNIGATALFIPAVKRISGRLNIPSSRLLMPMGFSAILGGTLTLVGSGPLIILNDLLRQGGLSTYGLFSVTPVGLALLGGGIIYFVIFGKYVLPGEAKGGGGNSSQRKVVETWRLSSSIDGFRIPRGSPLAGKTYEETGLWAEYGLNLMALGDGNEISYAPWRRTRLAEGQDLALLGDPRDKKRFLETGYVEGMLSSDFIDEVRLGKEMIFAELILPRNTKTAGKTIRELAVRKNFTVEPVVLGTTEGEFRGDISDVVLTAGCTLVVYGFPQGIRAMADRLGFIPVTPVETAGSQGGGPIKAFLCFLAAIVLVLFGASLPIALASGALAMILLRVISIEEAYNAIDWKTIILIAGLIPLGIAMGKTGAAEFMAVKIISMLEGAYPIVIFFAVGVLATIFSLLMSNVAATVLLVPLVIIMGNMTGINPRALGILVAVCAANSFILPTHQVNALIMTPGMYKNKDYIKAGSIMTLLFLLIAVPIVYLIF